METITIQLSKGIDLIHEPDTDKLYLSDGWNTDYIEVMNSPAGYVMDGYFNLTNDDRNIIGQYIQENLR